MFEPDVERNYKAVVDAFEDGSGKVNTELLRALAEVIEENTK